jgi:hypothetical protein
MLTLTADMASAGADTGATGADTAQTIVTPGTAEGNDKAWQDHRMIIVGYIPALHGNDFHAVGATIHDEELCLVQLDMTLEGKNLNRLHGAGRSPAMDITWFIMERDGFLGGSFKGKDKDEIAKLVREAIQLRRNSA